jgi:hypothetical protein
MVLERALIRYASLFYAEDIKNDLLNYIYATVQFSKAGVDTNVVAWNRYAGRLPRRASRAVH